MMKLRINPVVVNDLKSIHEYIAEDSEQNADRVVTEIFEKFENLQLFPEMGSDLSNRVSFHTDYKYAIWENYLIIYKYTHKYVEIYRVLNRYQDVTRLFD